MRWSDSFPAGSNSRPSHPVRISRFPRPSLPVKATRSSTAAAFDASATPYPLDRSTARALSPSRRHRRRLSRRDRRRVQRARARCERNDRNQRSWIRCPAFRYVTRRSRAGDHHVSVRPDPATRWRRSDHHLDRSECGRRRSLRVQRYRRRLRLHQLRARRVQWQRHDLARRHRSCGRRAAAVLQQLERDDHDRCVDDRGLSRLRRDLARSNVRASDRAAVTVQRLYVVELNHHSASTPRKWTHS